MFDIAINNGKVIDPANRVSSRLNIGVKDGRIAVISSERLEADIEINASDAIVAPGFIDMHIHEDVYNKDTDSINYCISESMLKMGVTTAVGGNCGLSIGYKDEVEYLSAIDRLGSPVNIAMLCPHENLRNAFGNFDKYSPVDNGTIRKMYALLEEKLSRGCLGLSVGLEYIPGVDANELEALMETASKYDKITAVHMRSDAEASLAAVKELLDATKGRAALQISHLSSMCSFGQMEEALALVDLSRSKDYDIAFDSYPYYAYCTFIGSAVFDEGFLEKYKLGKDAYSRIEIASGSYAGTRCDEELFLHIRNTDPQALAVAHLLDEREVDLSVTHPAGMTASDGLLVGGLGHPRASGTFPRFINEYVNQKKLLSLEEALAKITSMPAGRYGMDKGTLSLGADADITIFSPMLKDNASFTEPLKAPSGIRNVIISGKLALEEGHIVNGRLGRAVRR
ncbi:MAG: amidohydrolase family protein [Pseudomonadota bacterium]